MDDKVDKIIEQMPQWKRDLILRRRANNSSNSKQLSELSSVRESECFGSVEFGTATGHQPNTSCAVTSVAAASVRGGLIGTPSAIGICKNSNTCSPKFKMVQERTWVDNKQISFDMVSTNGTEKTGDSDSSEELQYGPGIVSKLKNRYLSLTLREANIKVRPSILRKATSLENLLDDDGPNDKSDNNRMFEPRMNGNSKNVPHRYRKPTRGSDMKRAHSVEAISRISDSIITDKRPKSIHEDVFIIAKEGNDKAYRKNDNIENNTETKYTNRINRPKRLQPIMNEREKPPADVVKEKKKIFEARPESRTKPPQHTGVVAEKVACYKSKIIQTKVSNKPPIIKTKPTTEKPRKNIHPPVRLPVKPTWNDSHELISPTDKWKPKIKSPDIAPQLHSPIPDVSMINEEFNDDKKTTSSLSETPDLILHSSPVHTIRNDTPPSSPPSESIKPISQEIQQNISKDSNSITFDFNNKPEIKVPPTQPLKLEINGTKPVANHIPLLQQTIEKKVTPPTIPPRDLEKKVIIPKEVEKKVTLSPREIEKNIINTAKTLDVINKSSVVDTEPKCEVPMGLPKRAPKSKQHDEQNSVVFKFTDRKDVPDYIGNDGRVCTAKIQLPKAGEGGITLLPDYIGESFTDYDEELLSLEGPPSPCDVNFINDNILIDGRSSLSQKTKKSKMRIQFVEAVPQIFEYPSESSMLLEDVQSPNNPISTTMGHAVPSLSGSSLANYTPKSGMSDELFQLGVTKAAIVPDVKTPETEKLVNSDELQETDEPILFSSGTNSDILF